MYEKFDHGSELRTEKRRQCEQPVDCIQLMYHYFNHIDYEAHISLFQRELMLFTFLNGNNVNSIAHAIYITNSVHACMKRFFNEITLKIGKSLK